MFGCKTYEFKQFISTIACPVANLGCATVMKYLITHRYTFRLSYIDRKGPMFPTIPNHCHPLDDLFLEDFRQPSIERDGRFHKTWSSQVSQGGTGTSAKKKLRVIVSACSFNLHIQNKPLWFEYIGCSAFKSEPWTKSYGLADLYL